MITPENKKNVGMRNVLRSLVARYDMTISGKKYDKNLKEYGLNNQKRSFDITVSFTTYPARIKSAIYVADALLRQTLKPDRVLLYLASDEFESTKVLPDEYKTLVNRGLTIIFVNDNIKPHKKYYFAMQKYPESLLVTVDDDAFYDETLIETLYKSYLNFPESIHAMRVHRALLNEKGKLESYRAWKLKDNCVSCPSMELLAVGVGGILYPPDLMHKDLFDLEKIKRLCLDTDDIWLKTMQVLENTPVVLASKNRRIRNIACSQRNALWKTNLDDNRNDGSIRNCLNEYAIEDFEWVNGRSRKND